MHIGQLIRQQVEKQGVTVSWLARQLPCSRTNVYKIFDRATIDTSVLVRISIILKYDFFKHYSESIKDKM